MMRIAIVSLLAAVLLVGCAGDKGVGPDGGNHPPVIQEIGDTTAVLGDTLRIQVVANDRDGDDVHFNLIIQCSWSDLQQDRCPHAGIKSSDLRFWFWPRTWDLASRQFLIVADDGRGGKDSTEFSVAVTADLSPRL